MPDTSHWITKVEAAGLIGVSTKTIESFANAGKLKSETRARPGKPPITVYDPKSVEKLRKAREPEILPAIAAPASVPIRHSDRYAPGIQWAPKTAVDDVSKPSEPSAPPPKNFPMAAAAASHQRAQIGGAAMSM
jgi:hypothetical protein